MATFPLVPTGTIGKFTWTMSDDGTVLQIALSDGSPLPAQLGTMTGQYIESVFRNAMDALNRAAGTLATVDPTLSAQCNSQAASLATLLV